MNINALQIVFFMNLSHVTRTYYRCEKIVRIEVQDLQVFVTSVTNSSQV